MSQRAYRRTGFLRSTCLPRDSAHSTTWPSRFQCDLEGGRPIFRPDLVTERALSLPRPVIEPSAHQDVFLVSPSCKTSIDCITPAWSDSIHLFQSRKRRICGFERVVASLFCILGKIRVWKKTAKHIDLEIASSLEAPSCCVLLLVLWGASLLRGVSFSGRLR